MKNKILIQRADRLGDVILSTPVIETLKQKFPNCELHVLTSKIGSEYLKQHPLVNKVIVVDWAMKPWFVEYKKVIKSMIGGTTSTIMLTEEVVVAMRSLKMEIVPM